MRTGDAWQTPVDVGRADAVEDAATAGAASVLLDFRASVDVAILKGTRGSGT